MTELTVIGISGSLRAGSHNSALLREAARLAPAGMQIDIYEGLRDIPPYNEDWDGADPPPTVSDLRDRVSAADGVLLSTPEYNYGIPGVLKNALDWASRPSPGAPTAASSLSGKPVAIMGASPSPFGSVRAQLALRQVLLWTDSLVVTKPEVIVFRSYEQFDEDGNLVDEHVQDLLRRLLAALAYKIEQIPPRWDPEPALRGQS
jgi:chromate reductase, NAD(P)H dehydrogenase (quinone)